MEVSVVSLKRFVGSPDATACGGWSAHLPFSLSGGYLLDFY